MNQKTQQSINIYYDQKRWHEIILQCIVPEILKASVLQITGYSVFLSFNRGDHIGITISHSSEPDFFLESVRGSLGRFIERQPSLLKKHIKGFKNDLFMNHANNSFWVSKYERPEIMLSRLSNLDVDISDAMISGLAIEEIDHEGIFTFIIYLQLGVVKAYFSDDIPEANNTINAMLTSDPDYIKTTLEVINEEQRLSVLEIVTDIWNIEGVPIEIAWINTWIENCRKFLVNKSFAESFDRISTSIYAHLGFARTKQDAENTLALISSTFSIFTNGGFFKNRTIVTLGSRL